MRQWTPSNSSSAVQVLQGLIGLMGQRDFESALLPHIHPLVPAASYSIYQTGLGCDPTRFMSASLGIPDTTRACWNAYLSGPHRSDQTLAVQDDTADQMMLCHITAPEVPAQHRARVYEAHGMAERISIVQRQATSIFAINFYRHDHQRPFTDGQLSDFESLAPALLALTQKQIELTRPRAVKRSADEWALQLQAQAPELTARELDVCARLLIGMTQEGIATDLRLSLPTVKTYRNRAFGRLGVHFKSELFALFAG